MLAKAWLISSTQIVLLQTQITICWANKKGAYGPNTICKKGLPIRTDWFLTFDWPDQRFDSVGEEEKVRNE